MTRLAAALLIAASAIASARTLAVGPQKSYTLPCDALAAARDGDTIEIDAAGKYAGDVCVVARNGLTIRGVNGRPVIEAGGRVAEGKGIWVIRGRNVLVENIEFTGATVGDKNGAGIRQEGANLTVRDCYFHHNENGILSMPVADSEILIEYSEFGHNGHGDGLSHNIYIADARKLTIRFCYFHHANIGHLIKTRAAESLIAYNRLTTELNGATSYEINFAEGGRAIVLGNLIEQGPLNDNECLLSYGFEHPHPRASEFSLYVVNNTFVNDDTRAEAVFLFIDPKLKPGVTVVNNMFLGPGSILKNGQPPASLKNNWKGVEAKLLSRENYDYRLTAGSPAIDGGIDPGSAGSFPLTPKFQYVHPACGQARPLNGALDIGAYEFGGIAGEPPANLPERCRRTATPNAR